MTAYEIFHQVAGGVVIATLLFAAIEFIQEKTSWL